jgi:hypothetical protein
MWTHDQEAVILHIHRAIKDEALKLQEEANTLLVGSTIRNTFNDLADSLYRLAGRILEDPKE